MEYSIEHISPESLEKFDNISTEDRELITEFNVSSGYKTNSNFTEINFFSLDDELLLSDSSYRGFKVIQGGLNNDTNTVSNLSIDPEQDISTYLFEGNDIKILYNFLNNIFSEFNSTDDFIVKQISGDRLELRLLPLGLDRERVQQVVEDFQRTLNSSNFFTEISLYSQNNIFYSITNLKTEDIEGDLLLTVKLYNPLPSSIGINTKFSIVEQISEPVAFKASPIPGPTEQRNIPYLKGPNFSIEIQDESNEPSQFLNYDELFSIASNNNSQKLNASINEKSAEVNINYNIFEDFINFSSIEERLLNFKYKLNLLESNQEKIGQLELGNTTDITKSIKYFQDINLGIINNFDHYERHLYFEKSESSWPKVDDSIPYTNASVNSQEGIEWFNSIRSKAVIFDNNNFNILTNTIPSYLREDHSNEPYITFINMIGHHFDNLWIYTKAVTDKYNTDNRLDKGISKDLVEEVLRNFGIKLYSSSRSIEDLFRYFTKNTYSLEDEVIPENNLIQQGDQVSLKDYEKEIYKRIYHNLPLLLKAKGTERGIKALINCFGIPSETLSIRYFGGQSSKDLPFFGGEEGLDSSLDKIRLSSTGSIVKGETLSQYTSIQRNDTSYTQDLHKVDIGFAPSDSIDNLLKQSLADDFNIDDYIGDPRQQDSRKYKKLQDLRTRILNEVHQDRFNVKDFVRLIKFFDNTLFKMIDDFIPARTVSNKGIIIKPDLLDRSKVIDTGVTFTQQVLEARLSTGFITGSDGESVDGKSQKYTTNHKLQVQTPTGIQFKKWTGDNGFEQFEKNGEEAKYDGEFSGSRIEVTNGELNEQNPFKQIKYKDLIYDLRFLSYPPEGICTIASIPEASPFPYYQTNPNNQDSNGNLKPIPVHNLFVGKYGTIEYTIDEETTIVPPNGELNYPAPEENYDILDINANDITVEVDQENVEGEPCDADIQVQVVFCNMSTNPGAPLQDINGNEFINMNKYLTYNISNKFNIGLNDDSTFFVGDPANNISIDDIEAVNLGNLEELTGLNLPNNDTSNITFTLQDDVDNDCQTSVEIPYTTCPLFLFNDPILISAFLQVTNPSTPNDDFRSEVILPSRHINIPPPLDSSKTDYQTEYGNGEDTAVRVMFRVIENVKDFDENGELITTPEPIFPIPPTINIDGQVVDNYILVNKFNNTVTEDYSGLPFKADNIPLTVNEFGTTLEFEGGQLSGVYNTNHAIPLKYADFFNFITKTDLDDDVVGDQEILFDRAGNPVDSSNIPIPSTLNLQTNDPLFLEVRVELGQNCFITKTFNYEIGEWNTDFEPGDGTNLISDTATALFYNSLPKPEANGLCNIYSDGSIETVTVTWNENQATNSNGTAESVVYNNPEAVSSITLNGPPIDGIYPVSYTFDPSPNSVSTRVEFRVSNLQNNLGDVTGYIRCNQQGTIEGGGFSSL